MVTLSASTIRAATFGNFNTFLNSISFTDNVTITPSYNDSDTPLPCIVSPSVSFDISFLGLNKGNRQWHGTHVLEFHSKNPAVLDRMKDEVQNAILADSSLENSGIQFLTGDDASFWRESDPSTYFINQQKVHMQIVTLFFDIDNTT